MTAPRNFEMKISMILRFSVIGRVTLSFMGLGLFLLLMGIWLGVVVLVLTIPLIIILNNKRKDYDFNLNLEGFAFENFEKKEVKWEEIKEVEFSNLNKFSSSRFTRKFYDPVINVQSTDRKLAIITQNYKESRALRDAFEEACKEKSIKYKVEDKG